MQRNDDISICDPKSAVAVFSGNIEWGYILSIW